MPLRLAAAVVLGSIALSAQPRVREPETGRDEIIAVLNRLVIAANERDSAGVRAVVAGGFAAMGDTWAFTAAGFPGWANRNEDIAGARITAMVRTVLQLSAEAAFAEGFFRTSNLKTDLAGDFSSTLVKQNGRWYVATVRFAPLTFEPPYHYAIRPQHLKREGKPGDWFPLFDGRASTGLVAMDGGPLPSEWSIENGELKLTPKPGRPQGGHRGIRSRETFQSFELEFEWKVGPKGNSGVKYGLFYLTGGDGAGYEYQLTDDAGDGGAVSDPRQRSGGLYLLAAPVKAMAHPTGSFNKARIIVRGRRFEHWLNGEKVVEYDAAAAPLESPVVFQHHTRETWFRNIRVRHLED